MTGCPLLDSEYAARQNGKRLPCERLAEENERLRELASRMARALGADSDWSDPELCPAGCDREFRCGKHSDGGEVRCPIVEALRELGVNFDQ